MQSTARIKMVLLKEARIGNEKKQPGATVEVSRGAAKTFMATNTARIWTTQQDDPAYKDSQATQAREPEILDAEPDARQDSEQPAASESEEGSSRRTRRTSR